MAIKDNMSVAPATGIGGEGPPGTGMGGPPRTGIGGGGSPGSQD